MSTVFDKPQHCVQPSSEGADPIAPSGVALPHVRGSLSASDDGVHGSDADSDALGRQLLEAMKQFMATPAAREEPAVVAPALPAKHVLPALPFDIAAALSALEHAATEEEAMAAVETFLVGAETAFTAGTDPIAALTAVFGPECVGDVTEVCAAAVVDLEAEAAATDRPITDRAASRIARSMVRQLTMGASRTMPRVPRVHLAVRGRGLRAPRSRRAHRRAVRLAAVASAGDSPPPEEPPPATRAPDRGHFSCAGVWITRAFSTEVAHVSDMVERAAEATL